ncbi:baculoviral IAP repeat-containing protein 7-B-like isoform X2 [Leguminivora glycinivorella]|nr:baculoviral IAP repeat-containing protein 7-B-like isoform X2 [Leguminivora glycinivorella]
MAGNEPLVLDRAFTAQSANVPVPAPVPEELVTTSQDAGPTEEDEMYKSDALRLLSFINWQDDSISREALVSAGFYHAGEGRLRCAWCGGELAPFRNLGSLGAPVDIHRRYFPRCDYALRLDNAYRASNISPPFSPPHTPQVESPRNSVMSEGALHNSRLLARSGQNCTQLGVVGVSGPGVQHPTLASLAARLATFAEWPQGRPQGPETLAEAGFFYTGQDDQVCCFYCDGGLGKWESSDEPWAEHARWFPGCGFVQLVKGAEFVAQHRGTQPPRQTSDDRSVNTRQRNPSVNFPVNESQVEEQMDSQQALVALGAGLDAARVRRAIRRRLQTTGLGFTSSEALIDAVLDEQLNEESWGVNTNQRFARDILAEALREFAPAAGLIPSPDCDQTSQSESSSRSRTPNEPQPSQEVTVAHADTSQTLRDPVRLKPTVSNDRVSSDRVDRVESEKENGPVRKKLSLEEENRQLKEARLCKVCMDSEVSVVFLPCGHLVSCARCGAALPSCPLCRSPVRALVRAYLA